MRAQCMGEGKSAVTMHDMKPDVNACNITYGSCQTSAVYTRHGLDTQWTLLLCFMESVNVVKCSLKGRNSFCRKLWLWKILRNMLPS